MSDDEIRAHNLRSSWREIDERFEAVIHELELAEGGLDDCDVEGMADVFARLAASVRGVRDEAHRRVWGS